MSILPPHREGGALIIIDRLIDIPLPRTDSFLSYMLYRLWHLALVYEIAVRSCHLLRWSPRTARIEHSPVRPDTVEPGRPRKRSSSACACGMRLGTAVECGLSSSRPIQTVTRTCRSTVKRGGGKGKALYRSSRLLRDLEGLAIDYKHWFAVTRPPRPPLAAEFPGISLDDNMAKSRYRGLLPIPELTRYPPGHLDSDDGDDGINHTSSQLINLQGSTSFLPIAPAGNSSASAPTFSRLATYPFNTPSNTGGSG